MMGMVMMLESMYPVATQAISSTEAPRVPRIWGRATLVMLMSRAPMRAPVMTVMVMSHLLWVSVLFHIDLTWRRAWVPSAAHVYRGDHR